MKKSALLLTLVFVAGCSSSATPALTAPDSTPPSPGPAAVSGAGQSAVPVEKNPPGDIPDNVAYVAYTNAVGKYTFTHPEGWAEATKGSAVTYTDKLNGVQVWLGKLTTAPTVDSAKQQDVPALRSSQAAFELRTVAAATLPAGTGVRIVYRRNSAPDPVTGRQYRDEVERYELVSHQREVIVELFGAVGSDNVDAYKTMITSLRLS